ncbi:MAG: VWA domain-containing protein [bacterium]|nr:VWA domain-containing protein [bacterium]
MKQASRARPALLGLASLVLASPLLSPALEAQGDLFFDTVDVQVVTVEVIVTDRDGAPVSGLTRGDFSVFEDGRQVELTNFLEVIEGRVVTGAAPGSGEAIDIASSSRMPDTRQLQLVVFMDNLNLRPETRNQIFGNLRDYLGKRLASDDRVMLVAADGGVEIVQPFTSDPVELLTALDRLDNEVGRHAPFDAEYRMLMRNLQTASVAQQSESQADSGFAFESAVIEAERLAKDIQTLAERRFRRVQETTRVLAEFTKTLAGMKGRKAVLYVSDGIPVRSAESLVEAWMGKYEGWMQQTGQLQLLNQLTSLTGLEFDASREFRQLVEIANANRVAFYPLAAPPRGTAGQVSAEVRGSASAGGRGPSSLDVTTVENFNRSDSLLRMAGGTGGLAYTRSINIGDLIGQMKQDFTSFYSLGYQRPLEVEDGSKGKNEKKKTGDEALTHELEVKVRREGLKLRYLKSYQEREPMDLLHDRTLTALHYGVENNTLGVRLEAGEAVKTGKVYEVPLMVQIPFQRLLLLPQEKQHVGEVRLLVAARDERGGLSPVQQIEIPVRIPNDQMGRAMSGAAAYTMRLQMKRGRQRVAIGVRDQLAQVDATLNFELDVGADGAAEVAPPNPESETPVQPALLESVESGALQN